MTALIAGLAFASSALSAILDEKQIQTTAIPTVSIEARGTDVRGVIHEIFTQAKKNYVLEPGVHFALYLSLKDVEFEQALNIVTTTAQLDFQIENGIYFVGKQTTKPKQTKSESQIKVFAPPPPKPLIFDNRNPIIDARNGKIPRSVLAKKVTTRATCTDLRKIAAMLSEQTGVMIWVDPRVPAYKLDAFFIESTLGYTLQRITKAIGLTYRFTDNSILIATTDTNKAVLGSSTTKKNE